MYKLALPLVALVFAAFFPVLDFDFLRWDDDISVTGNPLVTEPWSGDVAKKVFSGEQAMRFKPLHWFLFRGVYRWAGFDPMPWHAIGLVFHLVATGLLAGVLLMFYRRLFPAASPGALMLAAGAGVLLWALHPARVEAVAWVTGSSYPFAGAFALAALACFLRATELPAGSARTGAFAAAWGFSVCSFLSYPIALFLPLLFLSLELGPLGTAPHRRWRLGNAEARRWLGRHLVFLVPALLAAAVTLLTRYLNPSIFGAAPTLGRLDFGERVLVAFAALGSFPGKFLFPRDLNPNQVLMQLEGSWRVSVFLAAAASVAVGATLWLKRREWPALWWLFCGYCALAIPCLGLTELPVWPPDRYSYLLDMMLAGLAGAAGLKLASFAASGGARVGRGHVIAVGVVAGLFLATLVFQTRGLLPAWRNTDALFTHISASGNFSERTEQKAHIYKLWAYHHGARNDFEKTAYYLGEARRVYREAIIESLRRENPGRAVALACAQENSLGIDDVLRRERGGWRLRLGCLAEAREDLERALTALPEDARTLSMLKDLEREEGK